MRLGPYGALVLAAVIASADDLNAQSAPKGPPTAVIVKGPDVGQRAPDFALAWATRDAIGPAEQPFRLSDNLGNVVVVAFYPRDFTRGCTAEFQTLAAQRDSLFGPGVVVVGISVDSLSTHQRFARSLDLPFLLLSDPDQKVARSYGSAGSGGYNRRTIYVIRPDGRVSYRNLEFLALDPKAYQALRSAVAEARQ